MSTNKEYILLLIMALFSGCSSPPIYPLQVTPTDEIIPAVGTNSDFPRTETVYFERMQTPFERSSLNLWSRIDKDKITIFPYDYLADFTYDKDGSLWMVGGFGVINETPNGDQTWYSIKNGLPNTFFTTVAVSPEGNIWIGGRENALFRFDGEQWIDEGIKLPPPFDDRQNYLCYSKDISGIDFNPDGSVWVMNNGIEIYRQAYGYWSNIHFPKDLLPMAGGGACPEGIHVKSDDDVTIKIGPCCMSSPSGYHFDGKTWSHTYDYAAVDELLDARHQSDRQTLSIGQFQQSGILDMPFETDVLLPFSLTHYRDDVLITTDENGVIWLNAGVELFSNVNGVFTNVRKALSRGDYIDPDLTQSAVLGFGKEALYYEVGKRPFRLYWVIQDAVGYDENRSITSDAQNRVWFYDSREGLVCVNQGEIQVLGRIPDEIGDGNIGGVLPLEDGRVWVGGPGLIWEFEHGQWQKLVMPDSNQVIFNFVENDSGVVYGATDTAVYEFIDGRFRGRGFVAQWRKPAVVSEDGKFGDCSFHKRYTVLGNCPGEPINTDFNYKARFLGLLDDGSVVYINNRVIAKLEDAKWKSFVFDTFTINSATVAPDGYLWIVSGSDGLFRLAPDVFDSYQDLILP